MKKRTIVDQIEVTRSGVIQVRMRKQIVDDDGKILAPEAYHRTTITPGGDCDQTLAAVNTHLVSMGGAALADAEWQRVKDHATTAWTPTCLSDWATIQANAIIGATK